MNRIAEIRRRSFVTSQGLVKEKMFAGIKQELQEAVDGIMKALVEVVEDTAKIYHEDTACLIAEIDRLTQKDKE